MLRNTMHVLLKGLMRRGVAELRAHTGGSRDRDILPQGESGRRSVGGDLDVGFGSHRPP